MVSNLMNFLLVSSLLSALTIITSLNTLYAVINLMLVFLFSITYLISIGLNFLGLIIIIIYLSAVVILFIFTILLLNLRQLETIKDIKTLIIGIIGTLLVFAEMLHLNIITTGVRGLNITYKEPWETISKTKMTIKIIGHQMFLNQQLEILLISILLLVAMLGGITISKESDKRKLIKRQNLQNQIIINKTSKLMV